MDISILEEWVKINSGTHNSEGLRNMANALEKRLSLLGGTVQRISFDPLKELDGSVLQAGDALRFKFNPDAPVQVLFSGHMDTVYGPDSPFQQVRDLGDGRLNGPGITDMKGGLFIIIEAISTFLREDTTGNVGGELLITADEEIGSPASHDLIAETARRHNLGLVFEGTLPGGELVCERKGTGTFRVTAQGHAVHSGRDFANGRNAIVGLSRLAAKLHDLNENISDGTLNIGRISGGGAINIVPDKADIWINVRSGTIEGASELESTIKETIATENAMDTGVHFEVSGSFNRPPKIESEGDAILHEIWNKAEEEENLPRSGKLKTGGSSDGNILSAAGLPTLDGIGVKGGAIHSEAEFAIVASIPEQIRKAVNFLDLISKNPGTFAKPPFKVSA